MDKGTECWKVGSRLVCSTTTVYGNYIVRDTRTMWILNNGVKIRKGERRPVGEHGYGTRRYYSVDEDEGKKILSEIEKYKLVSALKSYPWDKCELEKLKKVVEYVRGLANGK